MRSLLLPFPPLIHFMLVLWALCFACVSQAHGEVVINEIYYDHPGKDDGYEFVELINTGIFRACMEAMRLEFHNGAGSGWQLLWQGSAVDTVRAQALFVIGGEYVFPGADAALRMGLQNGPDAVRIIAGDHVLDLVGYGSLEDAEYVEGASAGSVPAGFSLCRRPDGRDSDNNQMDFHSMVPSPGAFNVPHRDVSLLLAEGTPKACALEAGAPDEIRFLLANNGTSAIPPGAVSVQLWDSSFAGSSLVGADENADSIGTGEFHEMAQHTRFLQGYHFLTLHADYLQDERPGNNRVDMVRRAGSPHIFISEVMSCPIEPCPQYIEIFNAGGDSYDVSGHVLRDRTHAYSLLTSQECILEADAYMVLTPQKQFLLSYFPELSPRKVLEIEGAWPHLNHSGSGGFADSILISDRYRIPIEAVGYPPQSSAHCGRSLERVDLFTSSRHPVWILSQSQPGGSPGQRNEVSIYETPANKVVSATPNPFSPSAGEKLMIVVDPPHSVARSAATVFDTKGRMIKTVGSSSVHPYVYIWDGKRDGGAAAPSGIYILACEMYSFDGKRFGVEKVVVGCGKKRR